MVTVTQTFRKDPHSNLDYGFDWSDYLVTDETISASVWTIPSGLAEGTKQLADTSTKIWISGGTVGTTYTVANKVTTSDGRIDERSFDIVVENR